MTRYAFARPAGAAGPALAAPVVLALGLALAGCSFFSHSVTWSKPGVTDAQAQEDLATCTEQAQVQTDRDASIDRDISTTDTGSNAVDASPLQNIQAYKHENRFKSVLKDCMAQLGYHEVD
ncbi:MAG TPA: hypothetical protein VHA35_23310 [Dongiaceae bacterium]|jgi:hypothetical protein|nr:hypothetical protein [Dongiaceae bacterium]